MAPPSSLGDPRGRDGAWHRRLLIVLALLTQNLGILAFVLLLAAAAAAEPVFYRLPQVQIMVGEAAVIGVATVGQVFTLLVRGLDVSVNSVAGVMAFAIVDLSHGSSGIRLALAIAVGLFCAVGVGCLNAVVILLGRIPPFVATYATLF